MSRMYRMKRRLASMRRALRRRRPRRSFNKRRSVRRPSYRRRYKRSNDQTILYVGIIGVLFLVFKDKVMSLFKSGS